MSSALSLEHYCNKPPLSDMNPRLCKLYWQLELWAERKCELCGYALLKGRYLFIAPLEAILLLDFGLSESEFPEGALIGLNDSQKPLITQVRPGEIM